MTRYLLLIGLILTVVYTAFLNQLNTLQAQQVPMVTVPPTQWIAPIGPLTFTGGNPIYQWAQVNGASGYHLYIGPDKPPFSPAHFYGIVPPSVCNNGVCRADLTQFNNDLIGASAWLLNGDYAAWINSNPGNDLTWQGPFPFSVKLARPGVPTLKGLTTTRSFGWQLEGNAINASWFRIFYADQYALSAPFLDVWVSRDEACGGMTATTCNVDLAAMSGGRYALYMQSWGPGGLSTGGNVPGVDGWVVCRFIPELPGCAPAPGIPFDFRVTLEGHVTTLSWVAAENATEYTVWAGVWEGSIVIPAYYSGLPISASALSCDVRCTLPLPEIPADQYRWFVLASGPGGVPETIYNGWVEGPKFHVGYDGARAIYLTGQSLGNNRAVFTTVGDSITDADIFLRRFLLSYNLRDYEEYEPALKYFMQVPGTHSFSNRSIAAKGGWESADIVNTSFNHEGCFVGESPLVCEYRRTKPVLALIMIGTNNLDNLNLEAYKTDLTKIVDISTQMGVIPVLSTIPSSRLYAPQAQQVNDAIRTLARTRDLPLWDLYAQLEPLPDRGLLWDGIHLSEAEDSFFSSTDFTPENLRFGAPMRNLRALEILDHIRRTVLYD